MSAASTSDARKRNALVDQWQSQVVGIAVGNGDDLDVAAGRCCPTCRHDLTPHNKDVWNAGYSVGVRHTRDELEKAFNDGWHEHYLEWERQKNDPSHPITMTNPYAGDRS